MTFSFLNLEYYKYNLYLVHFRLLKYYYQKEHQYLFLLGIFLLFYYLFHYRILENTKDAIIKSSLTEEKQTTLNDKYINLFNELNQKKE